MNFRIPVSAAALIVVAAISASPARAQVNQAWCSLDRDSAMNCLYDTLAQCEATVRGEGGECVPNPAR